MKSTRTQLLLFVFFLFLGVRASYADTVINIATSSGNGITFTPTGSGGQYVSFTNLTINNTTTYPGDSANGTQMTISPGSAGQFVLNGVVNNGLTGTFAANNGATVTMGSASSGILTGNIQLLEIDTTTSLGKPNGTGSFSLVFTLSNLNFTGCTTANCTNSALLSTFAQIGNGNSSSNAITFSFNTATAANAAALYSFTAKHGTTAAGTMDSIYDSASELTPEPTSLLLLGTGAIFAGAGSFLCKLWAA